MANHNLTNAKKAKNDEFYTQFHDIQKEISAYLEYNPDVFKDKTIYCNCDDPFESNFFRYFVLNFKTLKLKRLISTSYKPSPIANTQLGLFWDDITLTPVKGRPKITANKFIINDVGDYDWDGEFNLKDIAKQLQENKNNEWSPLEGNGDFRSDESIELLKQADIVVTNPPFSLFREYVKQLFDYNKKFLIIWNLNAITYKEVFPLIKDNKLWLGPSITSGDREFEVPKDVVDMKKFTWEIREGKYFQRVVWVRWFTNLDHWRRHQPIWLMSENDIIKFVTKKPFDKYDNYDAIEVSLVKNIPNDYNWVMWVPISFLDKYSPEQFEIIWQASWNTRASAPKEILEKINYKPHKEDRWWCSVVNGIRTYGRILIKHKK